MKFIIGEGLGSLIERLSYHGVIGIFYKDTLWGVLAYITFALICFFAVIGICATLKWLFFRGNKKKMTSEEKWIKTGRL